MLKGIFSLKGLLVLLALVAAATGPAASGYAQSPTPIVVVMTPAPQWSGRVVSVVQDLSLRGSVLRVSVNGLKGLPVKVSSAGGGWSVVGLTGTKPEFGPYVVEFAALSRGNYVVEPQGLGASLPFFSDTASYITVEFSKEPVATPTPSISPSPTRPAAAPSATPVVLSTRTPALPVSTVIVLPTRTPAPPSPTPIVLPTRTSVPASPTATAAPPVPTPTPAPSATAVPTVTPAETATEAPTPQTATVWSSSVRYSRLSEKPVYGAIVARVPGQLGLQVDLRADGFEAACKTGTKPEYGRYACEFGGLGPGTYTVNPQGIDSSASVTLEPGNFALVEFTPLVATLTPAPLASAAPQPGFTPIASLPAVSPTAAASAMPAVSVVVSGTAGSPFSVLPPLPRPAWSAQVSERIPGTESNRLAATIVVRVLGAKGMGVTLDSGGWQSRAATGTKAEYGDFALEFGGLPAGDYEIIPDGLDLRYKVNAATGDFVLVDFVYRVPVIPTVPVMLAEPVTSVVQAVTPAARAVIWTGKVVSQTVAAGEAEPWGDIVVEVLGLEGLPVELKSPQGWSAFARTEARPGHAGFVVEFVRLAPGTYQVAPQGLKTWVELPVSKGSRALVEFASQ